MDLALTESAVLEALRSFLLGILPSIEVIKGQVNKVPSPKTPDYVVMTPILRPRFSTNVDSFADTKFTASISGAVMTVTEVAYGAISPGNQVFGAAAGTVVGAQIGGTPGSVGTYNVSSGQTLGSTILACGTESISQDTDIVVQLDVHGPSSADNAQRISTLFRDAYGVAQFAPNLAPLYTSDPKQMPFITGEDQYDNRWTLDLHLEAKDVISNIPQQFADQIEAGVISVEAEYPA